MDMMPDSSEARFSQSATDIKHIEKLTLGELCSYIVKQHHTYVRENTPLLKKNLELICREHGEKHPELYEIKDLFVDFTNDFTLHNHEEETILFPYIAGLEAAKNDVSPMIKTPFRSISKPIVMMIEEHRNADQRFARISELSKNYSVPEDAGPTYEITLNRLRDFANDLYLHIHLENNFLFPKVFELIKE